MGAIGGVKPQAKISGKNEINQENCGGLQAGLTRMWVPPAGLRCIPRTGSVSFLPSYRQRCWTPRTESLNEGQKETFSSNILQNFGQLL